MSCITIVEALETTKIHSVAGLLPPDKAMIATRPFRSPHHTISVNVRAIFITLFLSLFLMLGCERSVAQGHLEDSPAIQQLVNDLNEIALKQGYSLVILRGQEQVVRIDYNKTGQSVKYAFKVVDDFLNITITEPGSGFENLIYLPLSKLRIINKSVTTGGKMMQIKVAFD